MSRGLPYRTRLSSRVIAAAKPKREKRYLWDAEVVGLGAAILPSGTKSFVVDYVNRDGERRRMTIGRCDVLSVTEARSIARDTLAGVEHGRDPSRERSDHRHAPDVDDLAKRYLEEHAKARKKASSVRMDETNLRKHIKPALGRKKVAAVTYGDIDRLHRRLTEDGKPGAANRVLALASKMFNLAERWGMRPLGSNPCRHVQRNPERIVHRVLTDAELAALSKALDASTENREAIAAIRFILFSGVRRNEALRLKWDEIDKAAGVLRLSESKTGAKVVPLSSYALAILESQRKRRRLGNPYVFPSPKNAHKPLHDINGPWQRIREALALEDVRLHDLRHLVGATGTATGAPLQMVGRLLGHRTAATTARYATPTEDPARQAAEKIGDMLSEAIRRG